MYVQTKKQSYIIKILFLIIITIFSIQSAFANNSELKIISPKDGSTFKKGEAIFIKSNASDSDKKIKFVHFFRDNYKLIFADGKAPYEFKVHNLTHGHHKLRVRIIYKDKTIKEAMVNVNVGDTKSKDNTNNTNNTNNTSLTTYPKKEPSKQNNFKLKVISPKDGSTFEKGEGIFIKSNASDSDKKIKFVHFFRDNYKLIFADGKAPYEFKVHNLRPGDHILRVKIIYKDKTEKNAKIKVTVKEKNAKPAIVRPPAVVVPPVINVKKYKIGGYISGLDNNNSIILTNNGGDDLKISKNGFFNFNNTINDGSNYSISIKSQASNQNQPCKLAKAKGKINGQEVKSVKIVCSSAIAQAPTPIAPNNSNPSEYKVTAKPPVMNNPKIIDLSKIKPIKWPAYGLICSGKILNVSLNKNEDYIVKMSGNIPLKYPVRVEGGRNVRIVGLDIRPIVQPGCEIGKLHVNLRPSGRRNNANYHPRMPLGMAVQMIQTHTTFVEGVFIDLNGIEADCFVARNFAKLPNSVARKQRDIVIQNTACWGGESQQYTAANGDGLHGDFFQNQGEVMRNFTIENSTQHSSGHSIIQHAWGGYHAAVKNVIKRFDYSEDKRFARDDVGDIGGMGYIMDGNAESWVIEDVYGDGQSIIQNMIVKRPPHGPIEQYSYKDVNAAIKKNPNIHKGAPKGGHFAKKSKIGLNYESPHD